MNGFPEGFMWGTAASSTQTEGAAPRSDWARWEQLGKAPPSRDGNGFATDYGDDFAQLASLGLPHHRLSLEWARLEPSEGHHDPETVEHYRQVLAAAREAGIEPWVCMHHFTLPGWFSDNMGGFLDDRGLGYFWPRHVDWVAETFGDLVSGWKPVNEPLAYAAAGWLFGTNPPGRSDIVGFADALRCTHLANIEAWRLLQSGDQPVATVMNLSPVTARAVTGHEGQPTDAARERASEWARLIDRVYWDCWISLVQRGVYDDPFGAPVEVRGAEGAFDLIGFSYYGAVAVDQNGIVHAHPPGAPEGPLGDARYPQGLRECIDRLAKQLPDGRLLISEVGLGTSPEDPQADEHRCEYMREVIDIASAALRGGVDLAGLFWWTGIDNYEWTRGFDVEFGMIGRDRTPKPSARVAAGAAAAA